MKHPALLVFVSCESHDQAERIGNEVLKRRHAACIQIVPRAESMFLWPPGKSHIDYAEESLLILKTLERQWENLLADIQTLHTYENPEVIALPIVHIAPSYLAWMEQELPSK